MKIGFGTGFLWQSNKRVSKETIGICRDIGCNAIELHGHIEEFSLMDELRPEDLRSFSFVSYHAPKEVNERGVLDKIKSFHEKLKFDAVTLHPDVVTNWDILKEYDLPFAIENMDDRKERYKNVDEIKEIIFKTGYKMVLDINHCYTNDSTLKIADDFLREFGDQISYFHVSGYENKNIHHPLVATKQTAILDLVKDKNLPVIIESVCKDKEEAKKEFDFIYNYLDKYLDK